MSVISRHTVKSHDFNFRFIPLITNVNVALMNYEKPLYSSLLPFKHSVSNTTIAIVYNSIQQTVEFPFASEAKM